MWAALLSKKRAPSSRRRIANLVANVTPLRRLGFVQEPADQPLTQPVAVSVGGVPEINAKVERARQRPHRLASLVGP